ncbi:MAG TPA: ankyrin repeat domain-containing protein, partial [Candidatus Wallbacteria bacterium]|nr:ankyrin repeat domain-containing protein [Candidatus Wallbacteria bacterium]
CAVLSQNSKIIELLIKAGAEINAIDNDKMSALMHAAANSDGYNLSVLAEAGAFFDLKDKNGNCALVYSILNKNYEVTRMLVNCGADASSVNRDMKSVLMFA